MITKVWYLLGVTSRHDLETLQRANVKVSIVTDDYPIDIGFHTHSRVSALQEVEITTETNEQETWLRLCFGERLLHFFTRYDID